VQNLERNAGAAGRWPAESCGAPLEDRAGRAEGMGIGGAAGLTGGTYGCGYGNVEAEPYPPRKRKRLEGARGPLSESERDKEGEPF